MQSRASSRPTSAAQRPASGARTRPSSALPRLEDASQACAICRDQPLVFHECPECSARYCASGCLATWYEYTRSSRKEAFEVPVVVAEEKSLKVRMQDEEVAVDLFQAAGGKVVAELDAERRWSIHSVDGWELGQPGPGPHWRPHRGVKLKLEELGRCHRCKKPVAVPEYICNSAARQSSASRRAVRRTRTYEASTQTEAAYVEMATQTEAEYVEVAVQATCATRDAAEQAKPVEALSRAQAAVAGHVLASLASPAPDAKEMLLTGDPALAARQLRAAMSELRVASTSADVEASLQLRSAEEALQRLAGSDEAPQEPSKSPAPGETSRGQSLRKTLRELRLELAPFESEGREQVCRALSSLSELLALCMCPGVPSWRQLAESAAWPYKGTRMDDAPGWTQLQDALSALSRLALGALSEDSGGGDYGAQGFYRQAVEALAALVRFVERRAKGEEAPPGEAVPAAPAAPPIGMTPLALNPLTMGSLAPSLPPGGLTLTPNLAPTITPGVDAGANPIDLYLAAPKSPQRGGLANDGVLLEPPTFGKKATLGAGAERGARDMQNAMQGLFKRK